jgi:hypothetical protein
MTPAKQLRIAIETCEIQHPLFMRQFNPLRQRIEAALDGAASRIERVVGPSRVGKSMLAGALKRVAPESRIQGRRQVPVVVVKIPTPVTPLMLPSSVMTALGLPVQRSMTPGALVNRMQDQLKLAGTRVVIFEEASHLVEPGARVPPRAAGDWFKVLAENDLTLFLFGVPRLERLFAHNEQLRMRASASRQFLPYDSRVPEQMKAFHACVATYVNLFREHGYPIELPTPAMTYQTYLTCGGLVGILSRFMQELADKMAYEAPRPVTVADCKAAVDDIETAGAPNRRGFDKPNDAHLEVAPAALHQAYVHVMHDNDLAVPALATGGVQ